MIALRLSWRFAWSAAAGTVVALALTAAAPLVLGGRSFSVMSGSMEPALATGDLVITTAIAPSQARSGDIVTFPDPAGSGKLITHRVASALPAGDDYSFVTKGDANSSAERWTVPADGRIGRVAYRLRRLGYALSSARTTAGRFALISVPALALALLSLTAIWRPHRTEEEVEPPAAAASLVA